jgi:hypothetical protein
VEEQLSASLGEGEIAEFIEHGEVEPGKMIGNASLLPTRCSVSRRLTRSTTLKKRPRAPLRIIALIGDEGSAGEITDQALVDGRSGEVEVVDVFRQW